MSSTDQLLEAIIREDAADAYEARLVQTGREFIMMVNGDSGFSSFTMRRDDLVKKIKDNRANHRSIFEEAIVKYREACIAELDRMLADAKDGKRIRRNVALEEPQDHTRDYDRVITMLEMCTKDEIVVEEAEFAKYVMDDWSWKQQFTANASSYTGKAY